MFVLDDRDMRAKLANALECLLFVAESPVCVEDLAKATDRAPSEVMEALEELGGRLATSSGLRLVQLAGGYQICTKEEYAETVARFLQPQKRRLSRSALEVLAVVAYNQPITAQEIYMIRGVDSDYAIRSLSEKGLIEEIGRRQGPGRPILYGTTKKFLHQFNLNDLSELPPLNGHIRLEEVS